jgi:hypothetical protein
VGSLPTNTVPGCQPGLLFVIWPLLVIGYDMLIAIPALLTQGACAKAERRDQ